MCDTGHVCSNSLIMFKARLIIFKCNGSACVSDITLNEDNWTATALKILPEWSGKVEVCKTSQLPSQRLTWNWNLNIAPWERFLLEMIMAFGSI